MRLIFGKFRNCRTNNANKNTYIAVCDYVVIRLTQYIPLNKRKTDNECSKVKRQILSVFIIKEFFHICLCLSNFRIPNVTKGVKLIATIVIDTIIPFILLLQNFICFHHHFN